MDADYGGTEIRSALSKTLSSRVSGMPTAVFVLTDGEVSVPSLYRSLPRD